MSLEGTVLILQGIMRQAAMLQSGGVVDVLTQLAESMQFVMDNVGPEVLIPVIIFVITALFRIDVGKAARSSILIGVGFVGIFLIVGEFGSQVGPVADRMVRVTGVSLPALDVGWPSAAAVAYGLAEVGVWIIPVFVVVNLVLFYLGFTYTLMVDIWNFWHFAFIGGFLFFSTDSVAYAFTGAVVFGVLNLIIADWFQPGIEEEYDVPGISTPTAASAISAAFGLPIYEVVKRIPGIGSFDADPDSIEEKLGVLGEQTFLGLVIGLALGIAANVDRIATADAWFQIVGAGITFAAVMYLLPEMVSILMEGLTPLAESIRDTMTERFDGRDFVIGLDSAILIGHPSAIAAGLLTIPILIVMMLALPGTEMLWGVGFAALPFFYCMMVPYTDGDVVDMVIVGTLLMIPYNYIATWAAPTFTEAARAANFPLEGADLIVSWVGPGYPTTFIWSYPVMPVGVALGVLLTLSVWAALRLWPKKMYMIAGASEEAAERAIRMRHIDSGTPIPGNFGTIDEEQYLQATSAEEAD